MGFGPHSWLQKKDQDPEKTALAVQVRRTVGSDCASPHTLNPKAWALRRDLKHVSCCQEEQRLLNPPVQARSSGLRVSAMSPMSWVLPPPSNSLY